ncbi:hypothetical protein [Chitinophaga pinensis]|uniref:Uncharacterized protein n=1 Tax=Chitinophaga pinensis TaxID=79329 RepID=A0A5C6LQG9_9BACT|nr:hypothetical protein [Chitinophaga pinensis]TWV99432.1 hypothetical protein FEF09_16985 [Chitinophaga pinensis]
MKAHASVQIVIGKNVTPVIVIGLVGLMNPAVGIPLALSYLTGAAVLPAPQAIGSAAAGANTNTEVTATEATTSTTSVAKPITVTDELYAS